MRMDCGWARVDETLPFLIQESATNIQWCSQGMARTTDISANSGRKHTEPRNVSKFIHSVEPTMIGS